MVSMCPGERVRAGDQWSELVSVLPVFQATTKHPVTSVQCQHIIFTINNRKPVNTRKCAKSLVQCCSAAVIFNQWNLCNAFLHRQQRGTSTSDLLLLLSCFHHFPNLSSEEEPSSVGCWDTCLWGTRDILLLFCVLIFIRMKIFSDRVTECRGRI